MAHGLDGCVLALDEGRACIRQRGLEHAESTVIGDEVETVVADVLIANALEQEPESTGCVGCSRWGGDAAQTTQCVRPHIGRQLFRGRATATECPYC